MRGELRSYASGLKGHIRLLSNTAALADFLPPRLCRFLAAYPDLSVDLDERPSSEIALASGGIFTQDAMTTKAGPQAVTGHPSVEPTTAK